MGYSPDLGGLSSAYEVGVPTGLDHPAGPLVSRRPMFDPASRPRAAGDRASHTTPAARQELNLSPSSPSTHRPLTAAVEASVVSIESDQGLGPQGDTK